MALGITRGGFMAASALLFLSAPGQAAPVQHPALQSPHAKAAHHLRRDAGDRKLIVLYDQTGHDAGFGTVSQNFGDEFDSQAADDFTVPDGTGWTIKEVDAIGAYFNGSGPAPTVDVVISRDKKHRPGKVLASATVVPASDDSGTFVLKLPGKGVKLKSGHYWVSVVVNMDFVGFGEWAWENQTLGSHQGDPAVWQNPQDGFGSGCTTWTAESECVPTPTGDHMFVLKGKAK